MITVTRKIERKRRKETEGKKSQEGKIQASASNDANNNVYFYPPITTKPGAAMRKSLRVRLNSWGSEIERKKVDAEQQSSE